MRMFSLRRHGSEKGRGEDDRVRLVEEGEESMGERDVMTDREIDNVKVSRSRRRERVRREQILWQV